MRSIALATVLSLLVREQSAFSVPSVSDRRSSRTLHLSNNNNDNDSNSPDNETYRRKIRNRVTNLAQKLVVKPLSYAAPMPQAVAAVLKDATLKAVDLAVEEVWARKKQHDATTTGSDENSDDDLPIDSLDVMALVDEAFLPLEQTLLQMEEDLAKARTSLASAKSQASDAMAVVQAAAIAQAEGTQAAVQAAEDRASFQVLSDLYESRNDDDNVTGLSFTDVDYGTSEMAPPFLGEDQCLVPGEPVVRVEKAPENSRRIFAGVDIMASVDDVWAILTDYANLQNVVPNLVVNEVLDLYEGASQVKVDTSQSPLQQCQVLANQMKGSKLKQVGGAKVAGINFSARTTLEVREWPQGLPDFAHFNDEMWEGKSRKERAKEYASVKLQRYQFPRPFAVSSLPTRDISMQSVSDDDGEFRLYQGVWRMQPLPGCAPNGQAAMRLTYAVEISPRAYLPVQLVEGRIVKDLCANLEAIRDYVAKNPAISAV